MKELNWCIEYLKKYNNITYDLKLPDLEALRALENITMPDNLSDEFYDNQDKVLQEILKTKNIVDINNLSFNKDNIALYKGDITLINADAIVNAANKKLLGCFIPLHKCIDNAIHSYAGLQVRRDLLKVMEKQKNDEEVGKAKITKAYNLPSKYIIHTVGPQVENRVTKQNEIDLANCYYSCLKLADSLDLKSIVFCSISTGVYGYPIAKASTIAINTVRDYLHKTNSKIKVIFNLFSQSDYEIYKERLVSIYDN